MMTVVWDRLRHSRRFWLLVVAIVQTVINTYVAEIPAELSDQINTLVGLVILAFTIEDSAEKWGSRGGIVLPQVLTFESDQTTDGHAPARDAPQNGRSNEPVARGAENG